jgi:hypothetical protein
MNNAQGWDEQQDAGRRRKVWILVCLLLALGLACGIFFSKNTKSADEHWKEDIFSNDGTDMIDHMLLTGEYAKPEENELFRQFYEKTGIAAGIADGSTAVAQEGLAFALSCAEDEGVINTDAVRMRCAADPDANAMAVLNEGCVVRILAEENGFYQIAIAITMQDRDVDVTGYVKKESVRLHK